LQLALGGGFLEAALLLLLALAGVVAELVDRLEDLIAEGTHVGIHDSLGILESGKVSMRLRRIQPSLALDRRL
jgi:hypothetical protein